MRRLALLLQHPHQLQPVHSQPSSCSPAPHSTQRTPRPNTPDINTATVNPQAHPQQPNTPRPHTSSIIQLQPSSLLSPAPKKSTAGRPARQKRNTHKVPITSSASQ